MQASGELRDAKDTLIGAAQLQQQRVGKECEVPPVYANDIRVCSQHSRAWHRDRPVATHMLCYAMLCDA